MAIEAAVALFCISMAGNIYQFWANRKGRDLDAIKKEFDLFQELRSAKDRAYEEAQKRKDIQITRLTEELNAQQELINSNADELKRMNKMITFLISQGCQDAKRCPDHCPYSIADIADIIKRDEISKKR